MPVVKMRLNLFLFVLEDGKTARFFLIGDGIGKMYCRGVRARRVFEGEDGVVSDFIQQAERFVKVGFGFAWEAYYDVGGDADLAFCGLHPGDTFEILVAIVETLHGIQDPGGTALHRQMHVVTKCGGGFDGLHDVASEIAGMRGGEADPLDSRGFGDGGQQFGERSLAG